MKKLFYGLLCILSLKAHAQERTAEKEHHYFDFGLLAGMNQANLVGKELAYFSDEGIVDKKHGFHLGLQANTYISDYLFLKHAVRFSYLQTGLASIDEKGDSYSSNMKRSYMDIYPFSIGVQLYGLQIFAGPFASALLNAKREVKDVSGNKNYQKDIYGNHEMEGDGDLYLQKLDFGFNVGVEYKFAFGLFVSGQYQRGFAGILDAANAMSFDEKIDYKIFNEQISLSIGYYLFR